ncbi:MAG: sigma 54-interacting transcriptional regulator [Candidatus Ornithospirochaeta sp.]|nr:sigma 54-interacting transcriptional regulator [Sphaerochaetaceae bacterium]MDY5522824.1 sigma 54-interacting transcriptional regulator [Candidatus Ornithospirochaeta sp.]
MIEVLVIVPYEELLHEYEEAIAKAHDPRVHFTTSFMYGTDARNLSRASDYDIIVVRGMTSRALSEKYPETTIVDIKMDAFDVSSALLEAKKKFPGIRKIGLILPSSSICSASILTELLGIEVVMREVRGEEHMESTLREMVKEGCEVFIGGLTLKRVSEKMGLEYVHIKTGPSAIESSIKDAINAAHILDRERSRLGLMKSLVNNTPDSLLIIDDKGKITAANHAASSFFRRPNLVGMDAKELFPLEIYSVCDDVEVVQTIGDQTVLITEHPVHIEGEKRATYVSLRLVEDIRRTEKKIRSKLQEKGLTAKYSFSDIVTEQVEMKQLVAKALRYAHVEGNVLLTGETGTGKELFVQSMHNASPRRDKPFVAVNCAALSEQLLESELFGYTEGSFTGAQKGGKTGLFELAQGGTIFLDEIGEMPIRFQAKLLRVIQEREIRKIGGDEFIPVDVRIMSATNQNIPDLIEKGLFRRDLYYRINLLTLHIPPLRERLDDIPAIFKRFVERKSKALNIVPPMVEKDALECLKGYSWPGNIRELRNVAERAVIFSSSNCITRDTLKEIDVSVGEKKASEEKKIPLTSEELYRRYVESGLTLNDFALSIGISRTTLWRKFKVLNN